MNLSRRCVFWHCEVNPRSRLRSGRGARDALQGGTLLTWMSTHLAVRNFLDGDDCRAGVLLLPLAEPEHHDHSLNAHVERQTAFSVQKRQEEHIISYRCRSVVPFSIWISLIACSLPTPAIPYAEECRCSAHISQTLSEILTWQKKEITPLPMYLGNVIAAEEDSQADEILSRELEFCLHS